MNERSREFSTEDTVESTQGSHRGKRGSVSRIAYGEIYLVFFDDGSVEWKRADELRKVPEQLSLEDE